MNVTKQKQMYREWISDYQWGRVGRNIKGRVGRIFFKKGGLEGVLKGRVGGNFKGMVKVRINRWAGVSLRVRGRGGFKGRVGRDIKGRVGRIYFFSTKQLTIKPSKTQPPEVINYLWWWIFNYDIWLYTDYERFWRVNDGWNTLWYSFKMQCVYHTFVKCDSRPLPENPKAL